MLTGAELEYIKKMPIILKGIETQLKRIADVLDNRNYGKEKSEITTT